MAKLYGCPGCRTIMGWVDSLGRLVMGDMAIEHGRIFCLNCGTVKAWGPAVVMTDRPAPKPAAPMDCRDARKPENGCHG